MGNNEWGSPTPRNNPWLPDETAVQPVPDAAAAAGTPGGAPQRSGGGRGPIITVALIAVVALVIAAVVIWGMFGRDGDSDSNSSDGAGNVTFVPVPESGAADTNDEDDTDESSTSSASPSERPDDDNDDDDDDDNDDNDDDRFGGSGDLNGDRVTAQGFPNTPRAANGVPAAQCNGDDTWIFAGTNGDDRAVICQVGERGDYYYRGYYNEGAAEHDIDMDRVGSGYWVTEKVGSLRIEITSDGVQVLREDGSERSGRDFTWSADNS